jgi:hypothetical protein
LLAYTDGRLAAAPPLGGHIPPTLPEGSLSVPQ